MKRTILVLSVLLAMAGTAPASAAFLGANPRLGRKAGLVGEKRGEGKGDITEIGELGKDNE